MPAPDARFIKISHKIFYNHFRVIKRLSGVVCPRIPSLEGLSFFCFFFVIKKWSSFFSLDPRLLLMQNIVQSKYKPRFRNISSNQLHKKNIFFQADSQLSSHNLITLDCHSFTSMTSWLSVGYRFSLKFVQPLHPHT